MPVQRYDDEHCTIDVHLPDERHATGLVRGAVESHGRTVQAWVSDLLALRAEGRLGCTWSPHDRPQDLPFRAAA
ncbi:MAG: hypothetical protein KF817_12520 [Phycisphaeraceae bacterium]|nr:hypothetical protein [Phycisphaeraceae bacterium]